MSRPGRVRGRPWPLLLPAAAILAAIAPHLGKLGRHLVVSDIYWYDGLIHMYLSWERFQALAFRHRFFDFRWFAPYAETGTYNEPGITNGLLFGLFSLAAPGEVLAFNLAMIAILALNVLALYLLIRDLVRGRFIAAAFATVGALSPFAWARYFHPANTVIFWGLLGLLGLRLAARSPTWARSALAPLAFTAQLYSSLYAGMYFVVPLAVLLPASLFKAHAAGTLRRLLFRMGAVTLAMLPLIALLHLSYRSTRRELGKENSYEYVSMWMPKRSADYLEIPPLACQMRGLGVQRSEAACRGELFPGRLLIAVSAAGLLWFGLAAARRFPGRFPGAALLRLLFPSAGLGLAFLIGRSFPFHLGLALALFWPLWRPGRSLAVRSPGAIYGAAALLVADVSLNPVIRLFGEDIQSIYYLFFRAVPGFDGLRSEYRITVLLPVFLSLLAAVYVRRATACLRARGLRRLGIGVLAACGIFAFVDGQPRWQEYAPAPRTDRKPPVLAAAAALPESAVLAFAKGQGQSIARRLDPDSAYWNAYIISHGHRQITGKSTYMTPASNAIEGAAARLKERGDRLVWAMRLAYLFGGTHLIIDWREARAPDRERIAEMLGPDTGASVVESDRHMALVDLGRPRATAHGPAPSPPPPGERLGVRLKEKDNFGAKDRKAATDRRPRTLLYGPRPQKAGDVVAFEMERPACIGGVGFSPGLAIEQLPTRYDLEVESGSGWKAVYSQQRLEVQQNLIDRPGTGLAVIRFAPQKTRAVRLRLTGDSPFPLSLSEFELYGGDCQGAP